MNVEDMATQLGCHALITRAHSFHPGKLARAWQIPVRFANELGTSAGQFMHSPMGIKLHPVLKQPELWHHLQEIFLHELAHAHQLIVYSESGHGERWWEMMHQLGQRPKRTHNISAISRPASKIAPKSAGDLGL